MAATRIARRKTTTAKNRKLSADEKLYRQVSTMPGITSAEAEEIERAALDPKRHLWRRAALAALSMPRGELFRKIKTDRDTAVTFAEAANSIREYLALERELLATIDAAQIRIEVALCVRGDCQQVRAEAMASAAA